MPDWFLSRKDLSLHESEGFRPILHERGDTVGSRIRRALRRLADLQYGSIWRDLAYLLPQVRGTLVDVGSGAQPFRSLLSEDVNYIAVDTEKAEENFGYRTDNTRYFQGSSLPLKDGEADVVLCTETLEHVLNTHVFLCELARGLKLDGNLILTVPFAARWHFVPHDYWRFTPSALLHLLSNSGFASIRVYARGGALTVASYKVMGYVLLLLTGHGRRGVLAACWSLVGLLLLPLAGTAALFGNIGLLWPGSAEDTLGYTVLARKVAA